MKKELAHLKEIAQHLTTREFLPKLKALRLGEEEIKALKYLIKSKLALELHKIEMEINKLKKQKKDIFPLEIKFKTLNSKTKLFEATFHKKDFEIVLGHLKSLKEEVKNV